MSTDWYQYFEAGESVSDIISVCEPHSGRFRVSIITHKDMCSQTPQLIKIRSEQTLNTNRKLQLLYQTVRYFLVSDAS
jgi:hypothetical protein